MREPRNRGRLSQCERTFKILDALGRGRSTAAEIADFTGLSIKTVHRYIAALSVYFAVQEHVEGHQRYYWLDDIPAPARYPDARIKQIQKVRAYELSRSV